MGQHVFRKGRVSDDFKVFKKIDWDFTFVKVDLNKWRLGKNRFIKCGQLKDRVENGIFIGQ